MRPFDFMVAFWDKRYREYFVNLCLPSLLAPNNIPLLRAEDGHRLLVATTAEDWNAIAQMPIVDRARRYVTPVWIEVDHPSSQTVAEAGVNNVHSITVQHQDLCRKKLLQAAYPNRAYGSLLLPDVVFSDYTIASLLRLAEAGCQVVLVPGLRQVEDDVLRDLRRLGYVPFGTRLSLTGESLSVPQRVMAELAVRHLHPDVSSYDQGRRISSLLPCRYWKISGDRGLVMHTFVTPMTALTDFSVVSSNHAEYLARGLLGNVYSGENFIDCNRVHVVRDSDEFALLRLAPRSMRGAPCTNYQYCGPRLGSDLSLLINIRESMRFFAGRDKLKQMLFRAPVRWHGGELDEVWEKEEKGIERLICRAVGDYSELGSPRNFRRLLVLPRLINVLVTARSVQRSFRRFLQNVRSSLRVFVSRRTLYLHELSRRVWLAISGNAAARNWLLWRIDILLRQLQGYTTYPPRPELPQPVVNGPDFILDPALGPPSSITAHPALADKYTLVIPTFNRPVLLNGLLAYLGAKSAAFQILILDSSSPKNKELNRQAIKNHRLRTRHVEFAEETAFSDKVNSQLSELRTDYVSLCADDDIVFIDGLEDCIDELDAMPEIVACHGVYVNFGLSQRQLDMFIEYASPSLDDDNPLGRIYQLLASYEATIYAVHRNEILKRVLLASAGVPALFWELFTAVGVVAEGKINRLPCIYSARRSSVESWGHPVRAVCERPDELVADFVRYRSQVLALLASQGMSIGPDVERKITLAHLEYFANTLGDGTTLREIVSGEFARIGVQRATYKRPNGSNKTTINGSDGFKFVLTETARQLVPSYVATDLAAYCKTISTG